MAACMSSAEAPVWRTSRMAPSHPSLLKMACPTSTPTDYLKAKTAAFGWEPAVGCRDTATENSPSIRRAGAYPSIGFPPSVRTRRVLLSPPTKDWPCDSNFAVALDKAGGFIGRDAVLAQKAQGPLTRRLVQVLLTDPEPLLFHAEVVSRNGRPAGYIRSASYGFTLGGAVGLAMIDADQPIDQKYLDSGDWTVQIGNGIYPAVTSLRPMYDPASKRVQM